MTASDGARGDEFGNTVAVSGNTAIVGAPVPNSCWAPPTYPPAPEPPAPGHSTARADRRRWRARRRVRIFGRREREDGHIIGAIGNNSSRGAAYVFTCSATPCTWTQQQELSAADGASGDVFGTRVAVSGARPSSALQATLCATIPLQGAAYVFACSGIPCTWTQQQELTASYGASRDEFGTRVAVSGNTVIIGNNSSPGAAYVLPRAPEPPAPGK